MFEVRQVLTRMRLGDTDRAIARAGLMGRRKLAQLRRTAEAAGWLDAATPLPGDPELAEHLGSLTLAARWSMASPVFNQGRYNTANPGRDKRLRAPSEQAGIAVKSCRNPGQVFQESPSSAQESAFRNACGRPRSVGCRSERVRPESECRQ